MIGKLFGALAGWKGYALVAIACTVMAGAGGFSLAWKLQDGTIARIQVKAAKEKAAAVQEALRVERAGQRTADTVGVKVEEKQAKTRIVTRIIHEKVPEYVTPIADARCVVPVGFVRIVNAAASGSPPAPLPSGQSADAASGLELSAVADSVAGNYGYTHELEAQVLGWQEFYAGVVAEYNGLPPPAD